MTRPRVTVAMPVYNGATFVAEALDSWLAQDYADFELVVSDNASTDGTAEILDRYARQDPRLGIITRSETVPAYVNFNELVPEGTAPLFAWAAADDLRHPTFLRAMVDLHEQDDGLALAFSRARTFGHGTVRTFFAKPRKIPAASGTPFRRAASFVRRLVGYPPVYGLMKREILDQTQLFHVDMGLAADVGLVLELATYGRFAFAPEVLFEIRRHAGTNHRIGEDGRLDPQRGRRIDERTEAFVRRLPLSTTEQNLLVRELQIWSRRGVRPRPWWWKLPGARWTYLRSNRWVQNLRWLGHGV